MSNHDETEVADPFGPELKLEPERQQAATEPDALTPEQQAKANAAALTVLRHQLTAPPLDAERIRAEVIRQNQSRKAGIGGADLDADAEIARRGADYAAAHWSHLDRLALTRAAIWTAHADGYGEGVTLTEIMTLRKPSTATEIPATARAIVLRLSQIVAAPEADGVALARSDALSGIIADDQSGSANA